MTYRDDHDAALARADALEAELERTKRERDELADRNTVLEDRRATGSRSPSPDDAERDVPRTQQTPESDGGDVLPRRSRRTKDSGLRGMLRGRQAIVSVVLGVVLVGGVTLVGRCVSARWRADVQETNGARSP